MDLNNIPNKTLLDDEILDAIPLCKGTNQIVDTLKAAGFSTFQIQATAFQWARRMLLMLLDEHENERSMPPLAALKLHSTITGLEMFMVANFPRDFCEAIGIEVKEYVNDASDN